MDVVVMLLQLLGGLGAFLIGMNMMADSLSHLSQGKLRTMLNKTTNNRFAGVGIGAAVTAIIQSSSSTTVMVVGLVNAGVMTLMQATPVIMGANIGTTVTAFIATLDNLPIADFFYLFAIVGVFMTMLCKQEKLKIIGNIFGGVGLIFVGLAFMSDSLSMDAHPEIKETITYVLGYVQNPFLLLLIGALITAIVQSSSTVTSLVIILAAGGMVIGGKGDGVYYVIIGSNIGTCVTALLSSIGASVNARRTALIHLMFNCIGAVLFTAFLLFWGLSGTSFSEVVLGAIAPGMVETQIAIFHTLFNITCTCVLLPFTKWLVWLAERIIREKKTEEVEEEQRELLAIPDERLLVNPSLALGFLYKKTGQVFTYAVNALDKSVNAFLNKDTSVKEEITKVNSNLIQINKQSVDYLVKISQNTISFENERTVSCLHNVLGDILRIGDLADNVTKYTRHYVEDELIFSTEFLTKVKEMSNKIAKLSEISLDVYLNKDFDKLKEVDALEDEIDKDRRSLANAHLQRLKEGKCQPQNTNTFINLVGNLERAADHITYVAHSIEAN